MVGAAVIVGADVVGFGVGRGFVGEGVGAFSQQPRKTLSGVGQQSPAIALHPA